MPLLLIKTAVCIQRRMILKPFICAQCHAEMIDVQLVEVSGKQGVYLRVLLLFQYSIVWK